MLIKSKVRRKPVSGLSKARKVFKGVVYMKPECIGQNVVIMDQGRYKAYQMDLRWMRNQADYRRRALARIRRQLSRLEKLIAVFA